MATLTNIGFHGRSSHCSEQLSFNGNAQLHFFFLDHFLTALALALPSVQLQHISQIMFTLNIPNPNHKIITSCSLQWGLIILPETEFGFLDNYCHVVFISQM